VTFTGLDPQILVVSQIAAVVCLLLFVGFMTKVMWRHTPGEYANKSTVFSTITALAACGAIICGFIPTIQSSMGDISDQDVATLNLATVLCMGGFVLFLIITYLNSSFEKKSWAGLGALVGFSGAIVVVAAVAVGFFPVPDGPAVDVNLMLIIGTVMALVGLVWFVMNNIRVCKEPAQ